MRKFFYDCCNSPAKKLDFETPAPTDKFSQLKDLSKSKKLISELKKCDAKQISKMMKLSDSLTELNIKRYKQFKTPFNLKMPSKQFLHSREIHM